MDNLARRRQEMLESLESCRAQSGDLSDPNFAELAAALAEDADLHARFERLQQCDAAIKVAFAKVSVPVDLAERVAGRLAGTVPASADSIEAPAATTSHSPSPLLTNCVPKQSERFSRRRLFAGFVALTASAVLLTAVWMRSHQQPPVTPGQAIEEAMDFFGHDNEPPGELVSRLAPPNDYPFSRDIRQSPLVRWRPVKNLLGGEAVAYDLPAINGRATLFVVNRTVAGLPSFPPSVPTLSTGGNSAAAWQQGNTLYVLVVQGDAGTYSQYLDHSSGPLT